MTGIYLKGRFFKPYEIKGQVYPARRERGRNEGDGAGDNRWIDSFYHTDVFPFADLLYDST